MKTRLIGSTRKTYHQRGAYMNRRTLIAIFVITGLALIFYVLMPKQNKAEPITFTASASLRELTIDEKISEAQIIAIGEVKSTLPSKWKFHNKKDTKNATPQEIVDPGYYRSVNANTAVYEIVDGKAISEDDEWALDELISYIENALPRTP